MNTDASDRRSTPIAKPSAATATGGSVKSAKRCGPNLSAEPIRGEVLADLSLGWFDHWLKLTRRLARSFPASCIRVLRMSREAENTRSSCVSARLDPWFLASIEDLVS
jgi:hypothetical protein